MTPPNGKFQANIAASPQEENRLSKLSLAGQHFLCREYSERGKNDHFELFLRFKIQDFL